MAVEKTYTMIKPDDIAFVLGEAGAIQKALGKR